MLAIALTVALTLDYGVSDVQALLENRLQRLSQFRCRVEFEAGHVALGQPPFDQSAWNLFSGMYALDVEVARPVLRAHFLRDDADRGYEPLLASVSPQGYASRHDRQTGGRTIYCRDATGRQSGVFRTIPLLEALGFELSDTGGATLSSLLGQPDARVLNESADGVVTCAASLDMGGVTMHFEFDVTSTGMPSRIVAQYDYGAGGPLPCRREQRVVASESLDGEELPTEIVYVVDNPNVLEQARCALRLRITCVEPDSSLDAEQLVVTPIARAASIREVLPSGAEVIRRYDADGALSSEETLYDPGASANAGLKYVPRESQQWRSRLAYICAAAGVVGSIGVLAFMRSGFRAKVRA